MGLPGLTLAIVVSLLAPTALRAEDSPVVPGARVRVTVTKELYWSLSDRKGRLVGYVASIGDGNLMLYYKERDTPLELPFESVTRLEILRRSDGVSLLKAAGTGFLIGAVLGVIIGYTSADDEGAVTEYTADEQALRGGIVFGVAGIAVGLIIGLASGADRWVSVPDPFEALDVSVSPVPRGLSLSLSQRF